MASRRSDRKRSHRRAAARPGRKRDDGDGRVFELTIDSLAAGGDGVGRDDDGRVVFVPFTAPGDRVRVRTVSSHSRFVNAQVETLIDRSPARTDPVCAVFGSCGGCTWQHIEYAVQLEAKAAIVREAFVRIGGFPLSSNVAITPSPTPYGYRTRARVLVEGKRVGFRRRRSHAVCATDHCPILAPPLQAELAALSRTPPDRDGEWELSCGDTGCRTGPLPAGDDRPVALSVDGAEFAVSAGVFAQSNAALLETLGRAVRSAAGEGALAFDLYAGAGFFTVGLARRFEKVVAVESNPRAASDLASNLRANGCTGVTVIDESLEDALDRRRFDGLHPDAVVLDPPRTGLPPGATDSLAELTPRRIVYLGCDPATQARDARNLAGNGFDLIRVEAFDLFPQTPHVECLAVFEARNQGSTSPWRTA
jgi:23S rRNA (uracil1939-C5)-methyltransferase